MPGNIFESLNFQLKTMHRHVAAEVAAFVTRARSAHPGAHRDDLVMFVIHDIHDAHRRHLFEMNKISAGDMDRFSVEGIPNEFNPLRACPQCTSQWCIAVAEKMCDMAADAPAMEQYAMGVYLAAAHTRAGGAADLPVCPHTHQK